MAFRSPAPMIARDARRSAFRALGLAGLLLAVAAVPVRAAPAVILANETPGDPLASYGDRLKQALSPGVSAAIVAHESGPAVLRAILADPGRIAFAQRDGLAAFRAANRDTGPGLEIYGDIPACAVALIRRDGPFRTHADLIAARREGTPVTVDVGDAEGWTAATIALLRGIDASLAYARLENRGGARALNRVIAGETDALVIIAYGGTIDPALRDALAAGTLEPAPWFAGNLLRMAALHGLPYNAGRVDMAGPGRVFRAHRDYETLCTSLGVVVNANADRAVSEVIARAAIEGRLARAPQQWFTDALTTATAFLGRAAAEARRAAAVVAEPGMAWIARWSNAGPADQAAPTMRPASNLKDGQ